MAEVDGSGVRLMPGEGVAAGETLGSSTKLPPLRTTGGVVQSPLPASSVELAGVGTAAGGESGGGGMSETAAKYQVSPVRRLHGAREPPRRSFGAEMQTTLD